MSRRTKKLINARRECSRFWNVPSACPLAKHKYRVMPIYSQFKRIYADCLCFVSVYTFNRNYTICNVDKLITSKKNAKLYQKGK